MNAVQQLNTALAGRYRIEREVGQGGMATVYLALDLRHDRHVALKVLNPELGAVLGVERFLAEIRVTANLQHPNLLPLFDSGAGTRETGGEGLLFYVMPYVEGESLRAKLEREKQLSVDEAVHIATSVASALDYAHARGVIHRDLKPENILLQSGQPVVADFGIALAVSKAGGARVTQTGISLGTPQYMSPEQATGDRVVDGRSDIYSLGAVAYEMLTGEPPHTGPSVQAIIARVLTDKPRSTRLLRDTVPEHIDAAVLKALAKLPADRWVSGQQFTDALMGRGVAAGTGWYSSDGLPRRSRPRRWKAALPWGVATLALAIAVFALASNRREETRTSRFPLGLPENASIFTPIGSAIAIAPDGRRVAFAAMTGSTPQLHVRELDQPTSRPLVGTEGGFEPGFSPDGRTIVFGVMGGLMKVALDGGKPVRLTTVSAVGHDWYRSDTLVLGSTRTGHRGLSLLAATGGTPRPLTRVDSAQNETDHVRPVVVPDGKTVLFAAWGPDDFDDDYIAIGSLETGEYTRTRLVGTQPIGVVDEYLVYLRGDGTIMAARSDIEARRVLDDPVPVLEGVLYGLGMPRLASNGTLVFVAGTTKSQVSIVKPGGEKVTLRTEGRPLSSPRFSPDGQRIAMESLRTGFGGSIWIIDLASNTMTRLTGEEKSASRPEWSPDGGRLLYRVAAANGYSIWIQPADGSAPGKPLQSLTGNAQQAVFAPDGRAVLVRVDASASPNLRASASPNLMLVPLDGGPPRSVGTDPEVKFQPRISPDGRWLAYTTVTGGTGEVNVRPFPGPGARVQISTEGGFEPMWSRDGRTLYYRRGGAVIGASLIVSGSSLRVTRRVPVFEGPYQFSVTHSQYDAARDGRFVVVQRERGDVQPMVILNWPRELREKMSRR